MIGSKTPAAWGKIEVAVANVYILLQLAKYNKCVELGDYYKTAALSQTQFEYVLTTAAIGNVIFTTITLKMITLHLKFIIS